MLLAVCGGVVFQAVSFVGSDKAGRYIYSRAAANGKRVQVGDTAPADLTL